MVTIGCQAFYRLKHLVLIERVLGVGAPGDVLHDPIAVDEHPSALLNYPQRLGKTVRPVGPPRGICQHGKRSLELPRHESRRGLAPRANDESARPTSRYLIVQASQLDGMREALASSELPHEVKQDVAPAAKL